MEFLAETESLNSIYALFKEVSNLSNVDMYFIKSKQEKSSSLLTLPPVYIFCISQISPEFSEECDDSVIGCNILERKMGDAELYGI